MVSFEWDESKNRTNQKKHDIAFEEAQYAFADNHKIILFDELHSQVEKRYFCIGKIKRGIVTVRFTYRKNKIRIIGAAFWRSGKKNYVRKQKE